MSDLILRDEVHLPRKLRRSLLQKKILLQLSKGPIKSPTRIAEATGYLRESVSRSLHKLERSGRIFRSMKGYELTLWGKEELGEIVESAKDVHYHWVESAACFDCPCGEKEIQVTEEDVRCDCGRIYHFTSRLEVRYGH